MIYVPMMNSNTNAPPTFPAIFGTSTDEDVDKDSIARKEFKH